MSRLLLWPGEPCLGFPLLVSNRIDLSFDLLLQLLRVFDLHQLSQSFSLIFIRCLAYVHLPHFFAHLLKLGKIDAHLKERLSHLSEGPRQHARLALLLFLLHLLQLLNLLICSLLDVAYLHLGVIQMEA